MGNSVKFDDQNGIIVAEFSGDQNEATFKPIFDEIDGLISVHFPQGDPRILFIVHNFGKESYGARNLSVKWANTLVLGKLAVTGNSVFVKYAVNFAIKILRQGNKIHYFDDKNEAIKWLSSSAPKPASNEPAKTSSSIQKLEQLDEIFELAMNGDYSKDVKVPDEEDELSHYFVGVQVMLDSIRDKIAQYEELRKSLESQVKERTADLAHQNKLLAVIAHSAAGLLEAKDWKSKISQILGNVGKSADVSRVYIFEKTAVDSSTWSQRFEWTAPGIAPQIDNKELQNMDLAEAGFGRWEEMLAKDEPIAGKVSELPTSEQPLLKAQNIKSIVVLPIFAGQKLWGFIGFDECEKERVWQVSEISVLRLLASLISSAVENQKNAQRLQERTNELQQLNSFMVNRELRMIELKEQVNKLSKNPHIKIVK